jgi:acetolactate synthase I/II/III large subunit
VDCGDLLFKLAEKLNAPVATTLQGLSSFPGNHPLHTGMGIGEYAVPASEKAFEGCDCLLAIGVRFGEIPTGSFGMEVPEKLIHVDINPDVFNKNYPAKVTIHGDASNVVNQLLLKLDDENDRDERGEEVRSIIKKEKKNYFKEWKNDLKGNRVNPALFFRELRSQLLDDAILVADDGNHTFLTAELFEVRKPRHFICPTDFNCMGYCVPATIGAKLANPEKQVVGIVGDGAFLMTGLEMLTATSLKQGVVIFVFNDGELSQISQGQEIPYNRKVCTQLGQLDIEGIAQATGAGYQKMGSDADIQSVIERALTDVGKRNSCDCGCEY